MNEIMVLLEAAKKRHEELCKEREEIINKLVPLENRKKLLDEKIKTIEHLLSLEDENHGFVDKPEESLEIVSHSITNGPLSDKTAMEAYGYLIKNYFQDNPFKEKEIRELANKKGLLVNKKLISGSYSRAVITRLIEQKELERAKKGLYKIAKPKADLSGGLLQQ